MLPAARLPAAAVALTAASLAVFAAAMSRPDETIGRSFAAVLEGAASSATAREPAFDAAHLHLSGLADADLPGELASVSVGDRISIAGRTGSPLAYEIVEVRPLALGDEGARPAGSSRLLLVTAARVGGAGARSRVRFIVEAEGVRDLMKAPSKPHAL